MDKNDMLTIGQVLEMLGLTSHATIYEYMRRDQFPRGVKFVGDTRHYWSRADILRWKRERDTTLDPR